MWTGLPHPKPTLLTDMGTGLLLANAGPVGVLAEKAGSSHLGLGLEVSGAEVGGVWGPWQGACHPLPQTTVLFSSSHLFAVLSPFSVASALEEPTAEQLLRGEGKPLLRPHTL